jgi:hypothetical protein
VDLEPYFPKDERMTHDEWPSFPQKIDPLAVYGVLEKVESAGRTGSP